jgi:ribosomal protein S18 acetylase RimI-like enzyme
MEYECRQPEKLEAESRVIDLLLDYRAATTVYAYPTVWRLRLLWSSRVWEPAQDVRLWEDATGRAIGFALLWRRRRESPYLALERAIHPSLMTDALADAMLAWAVGRAQAIADEQSASLTLFTNRLHPAIHLNDPLETYGFSPVAPDPEQYNVYMTRLLNTPFDEPSLPPDYTLRKLQSVEELEAYAALSSFAAVNTEHRRETLTSDEYCHLVVIDPSGNFVAYVECSFCRDEWTHTGQRIGWIDYIETRPEQQRRGLGLAALLAGLRQLREWGTETAMLITASTNTPALRLYETAGFAPIPTPETPGYILNVKPEEGNETKGTEYVAHGENL